MRWWTFFVLVGVLGWSAPASADDEFAELNLVRSARLQLVEVALKQREIFETENGLLSLREPASELARKLTELENKDRLRQFQMIAKASGSDADQVGSEFALKNGYSPMSDATVAMRLHGSNTIGASLAPALVKEFLKAELGVGEVMVKKEGVESRIYFRTPGGGKRFQVIEVIAHGSSTAFQSSDKNPNVGLKGKFCEIGMASRPIKDSEADALINEALPDLRDNANVFPIAVDGGDRSGPDWICRQLGSDRDQSRSLGGACPLGGRVSARERRHPDRGPWPRGSHARGRQLP